MQFIRNLILILIAFGLYVGYETFGREQPFRMEQVEFAKRLVESLPDDMSVEHNRKECEQVEQRENCLAGIDRWYAHVKSVRHNFSEAERLTLHRYPADDIAQHYALATRSIDNYRREVGDWYVKYPLGTRTIEN